MYLYEQISNYQQTVSKSNDGSILFKKEAVLAVAIRLQLYNLHVVNRVAFNVFRYCHGINFDFLIRIFFMHSRAPNFFILLPFF